ncbi:MAG TPA: hypothetical protein VJ875_05170, partial [Pyrinomonadaceae bacterium]|nr:hypothetical protein [Pyrinomonadaceae bacterium]
VIGLSTVIAVTGGFTKNQPAVASMQPNPVPAAPVATAPAAETPSHHSAGVVASVPKTKRTTAIERKEEKQAKAEPEPEQSAQPIKVVMQIENGRVLKASIANHKAGRDSYEALALRIARQRRYPPTATGGETVTINVNR